MAVKARAEITLTSIRDVQSVTRYYLLQSSTAAKPDKPTTNPPGGNWVKAEPTYTTGSTNSLYFVDLTVFSDGTFAYSDVSLSSSYEAAKVAYNKAVSAEGVANSASDKVDNLEVGGRNLLPGTKTFSQWFVNYPDNMTFHDGIADIANTTSLQWRWMGSPSIKFSDVEGKDITVSMDVRSDDYEELATQTYPLVSLFLKNRGPEANNYSYRVRSTPSFRLSNKVTSEWTRVSFTHNNISVDTFTNIYAEGDAPWLSLGFWFYTKNSIQIRNIKMETGNIPTDWTPAPEDVEASISAANALAQSAKDTADGKITTFYAASTATPTATTTGDLWIKTDDGNSLWRWNGTAWVSVDNADIQSALTAAGTAQATADSKIVTFAQATSPTATDVGDIWIDTDDNNRMYRWNGTAWVDVHDPKIAEANEKIDNLQIGGRNLLLNSEHFIPDSGIFSGSTATVYNKPALDGEIPYYASGSKYVKVTFPNLTIGEQYAFSCEVARLSGASETPVYITINGEEAVEVGTATAAVWTKFNVIFTATSSTTYAKVQVYTAVSSGNAGWVGHFRHFKLERGNKATDWTPAPEDVSNQITTTNERIDNIKIGGRNLIRRTDYSIYGNSNNYSNANRATFSSDRVTIPFNREVYHREYTKNTIKTPVPAGTKIIMSVYVYEQTIPDGNHRLYVSGLKSNGTVNWNHHFKAIPYDFVGKFTWEHTTPEDFYGFVLDFDTRSGTSGQMVLGPVKAEIGDVATDWTPAPEDLEAEVNAAQETANGKNTVYYQSEEPSGGTYKTNDIWFDTNNGNKMYMWNGSAWTPEQFGNAAISDLSITNAKIANGTIESAKISNLDAGKVTSGTMSAARIKGDELKLGGDNNTDGVMKVYNADGELVGSFTKEGLEVIAGTIAGWTIEEDALTGTQVVGTQHWETRISKADGIRFKEYPQGSDPAVDWTRETYYNKGLASYSSKENGETHTGAIENYPGEDGLRIYPKLTVGEHGGLAQTDITQNQIDTSVVRLKELWAHPLGTGDTFYLQQPVMIMAGVTTISTGTSEKNLTLCTVPTEYQIGYRIVPFVSRRYGSASGTPSDTGDFYYAYYNSVTHKVHIKLANKLPSGVIFQFDYMIYAVPES